MTDQDTTRAAGHPAGATPPWWSYKMVWLVVGGPLAVVIASLITAYVAVKGQDPVLPRDEVAEATAKTGAAESLTPALQARNHAATAKP